MSAPQSTPFDPNKHVPTITESQAAQIAAEIEAGTALKPLTPEQLSAEAAAKKKFLEDEFELIMKRERAELDELRAKEQKERDRLDREERRQRAEQAKQERAASWMNVAEQQIHDKNLRCANAAVTKLFSSAGELSLALQKILPSEVPALAGLRPVLENLLKRI